ncbi:MAG: FAD-dependent oxidoreductase [Planctomycetota bacterium]
MTIDDCGLGVSINMLTVAFNDTTHPAEEGTLILAAAAAAGVYIPALCYHPDLPPFKDLPRAAQIFRGHQAYTNQPFAPDNPQSPIVNPQSSIVNPPLEGCGLCVVAVVGRPEPVRACQTPVETGMSIRTAGPDLEELRRTHLMSILAHHPHACLTCAQREGCSLEDCSSNVPKEERCCSKFHDCALRKVAEYVGIKDETPRYRPAGLPALRDDPLLTRDFNLCIDCARCVRICNQVRGVGALGIVHQGGRLLVGSVAPSLLASACKFCGACVEVCPTGCLMDRETGAGPREHWLVPCVHTCPAGVDVPGYIRAIAAGDFQRAAALVWETLPLPNVLGHICFHLCEFECRRGQIDDPLAICALKRFALENSDGMFLETAVTLPESGKRVAVIGGGPAGLAAAYFLRFKRHAVTVFEAAQSAGGMPALSIPDYRLPLSVLEKDLSAIGRLGVTIKTGFRLGTGAAMADLLTQGFDAVLVAVGLPESKKIAIAGSDLPGVHWGLEFLREVKAGKTFDLGEHVVIVGGGNVAIDAAMTARRLSGGTVRLFCLESRQEMPAHGYEIEEAEAEGIEVNPGWGPAAIQRVGGRLKGVEFRRCVAVFDEQRSFAPKFDEQQRQTVAADAVILAIGQAPPEGIPAEGGGIFLAGDIAGEPGSIVHAVASGREAAEKIDRYLGGDGRIVVELADRTTPPAWIGREEGFAPRPRIARESGIFSCGGPMSPGINPPPQKKSPDPLSWVEETYSCEAATAEARRCLQCDLRLSIVRPALPPEKWLEFSPSNVERTPAGEGVFVLADAHKKPTLIKGTMNLRADLLEKVASSAPARFFLWEEDRMYTKRESELIQQHLQRYGELPGGGDEELDDLY